MKLNADIPVLDVSSPSRLFQRTDIDVSELVAYSDSYLVAETENRYIASDGAAERLSVVGAVCREVFAELPVQCGWCLGGGRKMNGMEWHKSPEVIVACTDCVLILGDVADIKNDAFDSANAVALQLRRGEAVELAPETLHLAPLAVNEFFVAAIILPRGTNAPLESGISGARRAVNKWLLVHPENERGISLGGKVGVFGVNVTSEQIQ